MAGGLGSKLGVCGVMVSAIASGEIVTRSKVSLSNIERIAVVAPKS